VFHWNICRYLNGEAVTIGIRQEQKALLSGSGETNADVPKFLLWRFMKNHTTAFAADIVLLL
jgi:hypothetical protein